MNQKIVDIMCANTGFPEDIYRAFCKQLPYYTNGEYEVKTEVDRTTIFRKDLNGNSHWKAIKQN